MNALHYELIGVEKRYAERSVLCNFNLQIEEGEMIAITGPSGSGKSTVLNLLGLLERPNDGHINIHGEQAPKWRSRAAIRYIRNNVSYLFQNYGLIDNESVANNLAVALAYSTNQIPRTQQIRSVLARVGLGGFEKHNVSSLSGGEQQRVAVARLLLKPSSIVLADEPTGSLDEANRDAVLRLLIEINAQGKTVVIATHDPALTDSCNRQISLDTVKKV